MKTPFFSRDIRHKSPFGAVVQGSIITFRLILPRDCCDVGLYLYEDNAEPDYYEFKRANCENTDDAWWSLELKIEKSGLYFYYFDFMSPFGHNILTRGIRDEAILSKTGRHWQLTVFDKDFSTPEKFFGGIMYQIFPDRFCYSGKTKNNVPQDRFIRDVWGGVPAFNEGKSGCFQNNDYWCGDLLGIASKLDYLKSLSVDCIYLNPIFEAHSNHRYNTADYSKIDPLLGDEKDFKYLCREAHKRGIKIILDGVFSHTGSDSIYFNSQKRYGDGGAANDPQSPFINWYSFSRWPDKYKSWWDFITLPEVCESNEDYLEYICGEKGIISKWLKAGADGWRLDVADELPDVFLDKLRCRVKSVNKDAIIIGEVWEDASNKSSYGERRRYLQGKQLDSVMNYPFYNGIIDFIHRGDSEHLNETVAEICENYPAGVVNSLMNHLGTHDTQRLLTNLAFPGVENMSREEQSHLKLSPEQRKKGLTLIRLAAVLQYCLPGIPCIYYGDEIGMEGGKDPFNRAPYDYDNADINLREFYINLGKIRASVSCLKDGRYFPYWYDKGYISFIRDNGSSAILTAVNVNDFEIRIDLPCNYKDFVALMGHTTNNQVVIPPLNCAIIKMEPINQL